MDQEIMFALGLNLIPGVEAHPWLAPFAVFVVVGFLAQMVDGALGMAYGITSSTMMVSLGVPPQIVSANVHTAEVFTTGASGLSHWWVGNVDRKLMWNLALPGVAGGVFGALLLGNLDAHWLKAVVSAYLLGIGALILYRAWQAALPLPTRTRPKRLGLIAGFLDAVGGGGWGTLTSGSLIANNLEPRVAIGSVNAAEFFVTVAIAATLFHQLDWSHWSWLAGLIVGGVIAAPIAARLTKRIPRQVALWVVGSLVCVLSTINLAKALGV